jgi:hypothetical protein
MRCAWQASVRACEVDERALTGIARVIACEYLIAERRDAVGAVAHEVKDAPSRPKTLDDCAAGIGDDRASGEECGHDEAALP